MFARHHLSLFAAAAALSLPLALANPVLAQQSPEAVAAAALRNAPVFDGHNDVPEQLRDRYGNVIGSFDFNDTTNVPASFGGTRMHTDLPRLRRGQVGAQFWSVYVSADLPPAEAAVATLEQIDVMKRLISRYPDDLDFVTTADGVEAAMRRGHIASLLGMEGGSSIAGSLGVLRQMYALGARYMTLTHSKTIPWADSAQDAPLHDGLTEFGVQVVQEMARLGMLIDLSHVSEATMHDAMSATGAPVIFSHSGARAINGHARNVPDGVLERLPQEGGLVMVYFVTNYLDEDLRQHLARRAAEQARLDTLWPGQPDAALAAMEQWDAANPSSPADVADAADHIDHIRTVAGIDHIGLGADFDGMGPGPVGLEDASAYPALFVELARRGYSRADLEKIASGNMLRVLREAEAYAATQRGLAPIETPVD